MGQKVMLRPEGGWWKERRSSFNTASPMSLGQGFSSRHWAGDLLIDMEAP
jgi:hypothetical protein